MAKLRTLVAISAWLALITPSFALDGGRYGEVRVAIPKGTPRGYVVLYSDAGGWTPEDQGRLDAIAAAGALAVGVDTDAYLARVAAVDAPCDQLVGDTEGLSRKLQREYAGAEYFFPILAGAGKGGALAAAILTQAPDATLSGAVSLDPWSVLQTSHRFCPRVPSRGDGGEPQHFQAPVLREFWTVALSPAVTPETRDHFETLRESSPQFEVRTLNAPPQPQLLASLVAPHLVPDDFASLAGLPLVDLPASSQSHLMAVFLSGDGGWRDIDKTIAENLQALGVSVVGWDSVRYFWRKKTPEQTAADLSAVILAYSAKWHSDKVALIGFSFGADVLPFVYDRLRPTIKPSVKLISLLSVGRAADWEIRVLGWLGAAPSAEATPLGPAIQPISGKLIQCFYGDRDTGSFCPELAGRGAEVIEKKGIHHFDGNYVLIAHQILDAFKRRIADGS
jgi:type IV secretory pathway VirJ component